MKSSGSPRPLIGVTLDQELAGEYADEPYYVLRSNYAAMISVAGGIPLALPYITDDLECLLDALDGIVVSGGMFDIDPRMYGAQIPTTGMKLKPERTDFEREIILGALRRNIPLLGICNGMQLLGVLTGARLIQDIPADVPNAGEHMQLDPYANSAHRVEIVPETLLSTLIRSNHIDVNSIHHQAIGVAGPNVVVSAVAPDGIIEAIEVPNTRFALGVQWHPEYAAPGANGIFAGLVMAANTYRKCGLTENSRRSIPCSSRRCGADTPIG